MSANHARRRDWKAVAVAALVAAGASGLAAYAAAASYESLTGLAARHAQPLAQWYPASLDGGLFILIAVDISLTVWGHPVSWLRHLARLFAAGTIAANVVAGWPDPVAAALRVAPPALFVVLVEVARTVLLRRNRAATGDGRIPVWRWMLAPVATFRLWRRMKLWRVTDYGTAVDMEISRLRAVEQLRHRFGETWERKVPGDLAWMLTEGVRMGEALVMVRELCSLPPALPPVAASAARKRQATARTSATRKRRAGAGGETIDSQAQALAEYMRNPAINGREMADALGLSPSRGRALLASVRESAPDTGPLPRVHAD